MHTNYITIGDGKPLSMILMITPLFFLNVTLTLMKSDWISCANPVSKSYRGSKHSGSYFDTCDFNSSKIWNITINVLESKGNQKILSITLNLIISVRK